MKKDLCIFNIIADDYMPQQQLFSKNFKKNHPDIDIYCITLENTIIKSDLFTTIPLNKIDTIKNLELLKFKYNVLELSTAVKPSIFQWIFNKFKYKKILYFDSDIVVYKPVTEIIKKLDEFDAVVTPHIRKMVQDDKLPNETDFSKSGYFNAGFLGLRNNLDTLNFLQWWAEKNNQYCYIDFNKFYFVDQRWLDYAPIFLNTYIMKAPGYNVAYFNLQEYIGKISPKEITFIHYSGYDKDKVSVYQNRFSTKSLKEYSSYFEAYNTELNKLKSKQKHSYKYDFFDNQIDISPMIKKIFLDKNIIERNGLNAEKPFATNVKNGLYSFLNSQSQFVPVTNLVRLIYLDNYQIQQRFPHLDFTKLNQGSLFPYILWFMNESEKELGINKLFIKNQEQLLKDIEIVVKLYNSFRINNKLFRFFLRFKYFFQIVQIPNKKKFTKNIYLFLLERNADPKILKDSVENKIKISDYKKKLLNNIINGGEFKDITSLRTGKKSILTIKFIYKLLGFMAI